MRECNDIKTFTGKNSAADDRQKQKERAFCSVMRSLFVLKGIQTVLCFFANMASFEIIIVTKFVLTAPIYSEQYSGLSLVRVRSGINWQQRIYQERTVDENCADW